MSSCPGAGAPYDPMLGDFDSLRSHRCEAALWRGSRFFSHPRPFGPLALSDTPWGPFVRDRGTTNGL